MNERAVARKCQLYNNFSCCANKRFDYEMFTPPPSHPLPGMLAIAAANKILKELRAHDLMAVDKSRNMEHSGTFRNIPEHQKIILWEKCVKLNKEITQQEN